MRKVTLAAAAAALALVPVAQAGAAPPGSASCEGVFAAGAGQYAPGTVADLTHQLQAEAGGTPMGLLNRQYAQQKGDCV